jgi:uncharacterized membrane protein
MSSTATDTGTNNNSWPAAVVASAIILVLGAIAWKSIDKSPADHALDIWSGVSGLLGLVTGVIATYFFTSTTIQTVTNQAQRAMLRAEEAQNSLARERQQLTANVGAAFTAAHNLLPADQWDRLRADPVIKAVLPPGL